MKLLLPVFLFLQSRYSMSMHSNGKCRIRFNQQPSDKDKTDWCELYFEDITLELRMQCRMYICYDRSSQVPRPSCEVGVG